MSKKQEIPYGFCHCGCGQKTTISKDTNFNRGLVRGEPHRFLIGHGRCAPIAIRFWEKVKKRGPDECWEWSAGKNAQGYGKIRINGCPEGAHRVAWSLVNGPIPEGKIVMHKCDNPSCCNIAHLEIGTYGDNVRDMVKKGRHVHVKKIVTEEQVREMRKRYAQGGIFLRELAAENNMSIVGIHSIIRRKTWKHVE